MMPDSADMSLPRNTSARPRVVMVGTHPETRGGISSVVRGYMQGGLFDRVNCRYIVTHRDGSVLQKATTALSGWFRTFLSLAGRGRPLVHVHLSSRASFWRKSVVCLIARVMGCPYLLHVHGSEFMQFFDHECGRASKRIVRAVFRHAVIVLALSEEWRASLLTIYSGARIVVLHNAVAVPAMVTAGRDELRPQRILALGRIGTRKGTFDLIRAFSQIAPRFPDCKLICAGDGEREAAIELATQLGIADRFECPGWLDTKETERQLAAATIFALPSYAEGLPMALLEAMASAIPVVASPVGGIPQVVHHGVNGLLMSPGDVPALASALSTLLSDRAARIRLGDAARKTIGGRFSLDAAISRLLGIYRELGVLDVKDKTRGG